MNETILTLKRITIESIKKACLVFSLIFVLTSIFFGLFGNNLLPSNEPYRLAFFFSVKSAELALIYTVFDNIHKLKRWKHWIVASCLAIWCLFWIMYEIINEGDGLGSVLAFDSLIIGIAAWILCAIRFPKYIYVIATGAMIVVMAVYLFFAIVAANIYCR